jgi:putative SOS response-associated peptidase YedK
MCGRYFRRSDKQRIAEAFHLGVFEDLPLEAAPSYNIAPTTMQPVIRNNRDAERPPVDLLRPYEAVEMDTHPVDPRVGSVRNNEPGLCALWDCPPNSQ